MTSAEDADSAKPDPDTLQAALDKVGVSADNAVTVGDTVWDGQAAATAGVRFIGLRSGESAPLNFAMPDCLSIFSQGTTTCGCLTTSPKSWAFRSTGAS